MSQGPYPCDEPSAVARGVLLGGLALTLMMMGCAPPPTEGAEGEGALDPERLDRSADGYPGPGPEGYGAQVGQRLANSDGLQLVDCDGQVRDFAEFFESRADGLHNRGTLLSIGAGWCGPCQEETVELPELYEEFYDRGIEIVQVMFQDWASQAPTTAFCRDWVEGRWEGESLDLALPFPVFVDQLGDWTNIYLQDPQASTPINLLVDANANIRFKSEGVKVDAADLRLQFELVIESPYEIPR